MPSFEHNGERYTYIVLAFQALSLEQLYLITKIRQEVFVVEQDCVFTDSDGFDLQAHHLIVYNQAAEIVAYARFLPSETIYEQATIGRVLTIKKYRQTGLGRVLFALAIDALYATFGAQDIKIQAQSYLLKFYESYGFVSYTAAYLDTGIWHNDMIKKA